MSGRKASEVNELLKNGEKTRNGSISILESTINDATKKLDELNKITDELINVVNNFSETVTQDSFNEFSDVATNLNNSINKWKAECKNICSKENINVQLKKKENIMSEYKETDKEADNVRYMLKNKLAKQWHDWYCDEEYSMANKVQQKYKRISSNVNSLQSEASKVVVSLVSKKTLINEKIKQGQTLKKEIIELNKKSEEIKKLRKKASDAKNTVKKELESIEENIAKKFLDKDYNLLKTKVDKFINLSDNEIINQCTNMIAEITTFKNTLNSVYAKYLERKECLESKYKSAFDRITNKVFSHPEDEYKKTKREKLGLKEFLSMYVKSKYVDKINSDISEIRELINNDKFDEAENMLSSFTNLCDEAGITAAKAHENMMKSIGNMLAIKKTMLDLKYDVRVDKIDKGGNPADGYCITCTVGDEIIKFDRVNVIEDGKPVIDIDHHESVSGTCKSTWRDISKALAENDIFIEDITKDGVSIFGNSKAVKKETKNKNMTLN